MGEKKGKTIVGTGTTESRDIMKSNPSNLRVGQIV